LAISPTTLSPSLDRAIEASNRAKLIEVIEIDASRKKNESSL
jgi:hypothetical protein